MCIFSVWHLLWQQRNYFFVQENIFYCVYDNKTFKFCQDSETKPAAGGDLKSFQGMNMYRMQNSKEKKNAYWHQRE